jgi:tetratricopeptide (TPR) repeat protein
MTTSSLLCAKFVTACAVSALLAISAPARADPQADCRWATNDPGAVIRACTILIEGRTGAKAWMHFNRGLAFKVAGRLEEAENDYSKAIDIEPRYAAAYTNRGNVRLLRNDAAGAVQDYRRAFRLDPKDRVARRNLQAIEAALGQVGADKSGKGVTSGPAK